MGSHPDRFRGLGRRGRVAISGPGQPGRRLAQLHGRGRVGHVAASDPAFRAPFRLGDDQPGAGITWTEPGGRRRPACRGRRFLAALTWLATGVVPGVWLVLTGWSPELVPDPGGNAPDAGECLAPGAGPGRARQSRPRRPAFRARSSAGTAIHVRRASGPGVAAQSAGGPGGAVAPDDRDRCRAGRLRIELVGTGRMSGMRRYGNG